MSGGPRWFRPVGRGRSARASFQSSPLETFFSDENISSLPFLVFASYYRFLLPLLFLPYWSPLTSTYRSTLTLRDPPGPFVDIELTRFHRVFRCSSAKTTSILFNFLTACVFRLPEWFLSLIFRIGGFSLASCTRPSTHSLVHLPTFRTFFFFASFLSKPVTRFYFRQSSSSPPRFPSFLP